jgi:hypothetical protein
MEKNKKVPKEKIKNNPTTQSAKQTAPVEPGSTIDKQVYQVQSEILGTIVAIPNEEIDILPDTSNVINLKSTDDLNGVNIANGVVDAEVKTPYNIVDTIEFKNGENTLKIALVKKDLRMFRIQIFLNDLMEIRPVTYTGANPAMTMWNLLKQAVK